jgi:hypothetical protein
VNHLQIDEILDEKLIDLLSWAKAKGIKLNKAEIVDVPGFKYGVQATQKINVGITDSFVMSARLEIKSFLYPTKR